jgi:anti-sigma factor RsiW
MIDPSAAAEANFDDDELVAYLDGELDAEATRRIEQRLAQDPVARQRLRELQSSWDLMDILPRAEVSNGFTQTTVAMIALQEAESVAVARKPIAKRLSAWVLSTAGVVAAGILGFALVYSVYSQPERELLRDLPLIENMDMYQAADSVEFLRSLKREGLFQEETSDGL